MSGLWLALWYAPVLSEHVGFLSLLIKFNSQVVNIVSQHDCTVGSQGD